MKYVWLVVYAPDEVGHPNAYSSKKKAKKVIDEEIEYSRKIGFSPIVSKDGLSFSYEGLAVSVTKVLVN